MGDFQQKPLEMVMFLLEGYIFRVSQTNPWNIRNASTECPVSCRQHIPYPFNTFRKCWTNAFFTLRCQCLEVTKQTQCVALPKSLCKSCTAGGSSRLGRAVGTPGYTLPFGVLIRESAWLRNASWVMLTYHISGNCSRLTS